MFCYKKETEKMELVTLPDGIDGPGAVCLTGSMMTSLKAELILKWPRIPPDEEQDVVPPSRSDPDPDDIEQFSTDSVALAGG